MKKAMAILFLATVIFSCSSNDSSKTTTSTTEKTPETNTTAQPSAASAEADKGLDLVAKSDCFTCHKVSEKLVGPAYEEVAAKYPNNQATIDSLSAKVIRGGAGNWGQVPMTPHPNLSKEDAETMVKYVMSLKK